LYKPVTFDLFLDELHRRVGVFEILIKIFLVRAIDGVEKSRGMHAITKAAAHTKH